MARRFMAMALHRNLLHRDTAGAVETRSAQDLVAAALDDIALKSTRGFHALAVTFDIDSAFPSVKTDALELVLSQMGFPQSTVDLAVSFCRNRTFRFRWAQMTFTSNNGLPQGSPWSPILFLLVTAPLPRTDHTFQYADDICQITFAKNPANLGKRATRRAGALRTAAAKLGLRLDEKKTEAQLFRRSGRKSTKNWNPDGVTVRVGNSTIKPGKITWVGCRLHFNDHMSHRAERAHKTIGLLQRTNNTIKGIPPVRPKT
ncbi:hypothetical protein VTH06DRAFT_8810 [Thermothelomyces fergusii]